jgi:hypothetical protein
MENEQKNPASAQNQAHSQLLGVFPEQSEAEVHSALEQAGGELEQAAGILLQNKNGMKTACDGDELKAVELLTEDYKTLLEEAESKLRDLETKEENYKEKYMGLLERHRRSGELASIPYLVITVVKQPHCGSSSKSLQS